MHSVKVYNAIRNSKVYGRYLPKDVIQTELNLLGEVFELKVIGRSAKGEAVSLLKAGRGPTRILAWSQMHGNETTTTKAALDYFSFLQNNTSEEVEEILSRVTFYLIPILNPDGAAAYTRVNANGVDLNRDAKELKEVESRILRQILEDLNPDYCFNLHDQRTIFSAGDTNAPATLSFLAPANDEERTINSVRETAMRIIAGIHNDLEEVLPERIGRYDDTFNPNCTGDQFQQIVPTLLFEAGHYPEDYQREQTRYYMFLAIRSAVNHILKQSYKSYGIASYFRIPENHKNFVDILLKNVHLKGQLIDVAIQFQETLNNNTIDFIPKVLSKGPNLPLYGHKEIDCVGALVTINEGNDIAENDLVASVLLNAENLSLKME